MFVAFRAIVYATLFISLILLYLPARVLAWAGIAHTPALHADGAIALIVGTGAALLALWCVVAFIVLGKGTPAPFDPPRRLVARGPYRYVRNPMYIGAGLAITCAAVFYRSLALLVFALGFWLVCHIFVMAYEEPHLRRVFGEEYALYCRSVHRWLPHF